jgi:hypothetical protein
MLKMRIYWFLNKLDGTYIKKEEKYHVYLAEPKCIQVLGIENIKFELLC